MSFDSGIVCAFHNSFVQINVCEYVWKGTCFKQLIGLPVMCPI